MRHATSVLAATHNTQFRSHYRPALCSMVAAAVMLPVVVVAVIPAVVILLSSRL